MIRPAIPADIFALLDMGAAFFVEASWDKCAAFDKDSFAYTCGCLITDGVLLVAEKDGVVIGMAGAGFAPAYWNRNILTAQELFFFCVPEHRKGTGRKLMDGLESAVTERGAVLFSMSAEEGLRSEALGRLYRQRGYWPAEKLFWKRLEAVAA